MSNSPESSNVPHLAPDINPAVARQMSQEYATQMSRLDSLLRSYPGAELDELDRSDAGIDIEIAPHTYITRDITGDSLNIYNMPISGFGTGLVDFKNDNARISPIPGVTFPDTTYTLEIGLHLDERSLPQVEELGKNMPFTMRRCRTIYAFDQAGNFYKEVWLPKEVEDDRPLDQVHTDFLEPQGLAHRMRSRIVGGEMTTRDFELVGFVLHKLESVLSSSN